MYRNEDDVKSHFKVAQLWHLVKNLRGKYITKPPIKNIDSHKTILKNLLKEDFDINHKVTIHSEELILKEYLKDCTALHFTYHNTYDIDACKILLEHGADFTAKNGAGQTMLHSAITSNKYLRKHAVSFANSILSAHVKFQNVTNPQDNNGISHLHGACLVNHVESLKLFLDNGASIDQAVNLKSAHFAGYTPLHFAAEFKSFEAMQLLLSRGANVNVKNAHGLTPLDVCMICRLNLLDLLSYVEDDTDPARRSYLDSLFQNETMIKLLLDSQCVSGVGLSNLHVASSFKDLSFIKNIIDQTVDINNPVPKESSIYPGYTAAHFASLYSADNVKIFVTRGAKLNIEDVNGSTPLDICVARYSLQEIHNILSYNEDWKRIYLSDGKTTLFDVVRCTTNLSQFKQLLQNVTEDTIVPNNSSFWQGYTILHLAVITAKKTREFAVKECLKIGINVNLQNQRGETAIHLAIKLRKRKIVKLLLEHLDKHNEVTNLVDQDNLSYLHIACAEKNESLVKKLLERTSDPNIVYKGKNIHHELSIVTGSTPLHVAVSNGCLTISQMLLRQGANLHATDLNGLTPIHCLLLCYRNGPYIRQGNSMAKVLFDALLENPKDCVIDDIRLNYLHVACYLGNVQVARKLLEIGSDVNAIVSLTNKSMKTWSYDRMMYLKMYNSFTPLHMVQANPIDEVIDLLILHGAELFSKSRSSNVNFPLQNVNIMYRFMALLWDREDMQKSMEEKLGLTRLHIACYMKDYESIEIALNGKTIDVNARIHEDSDVFAGCTPLHLLLTIHRNVTSEKIGIDNSMKMEIPQNKVKRLANERMIKLLLDSGADVTIMNADENTPIHLIHEDKYCVGDVNDCKGLLLNAQRDFSINPTNKEGMSHFHLACLWHKVEIVEKFLQHGPVDVNQPTDLFAKHSAGFTPLHLTLDCSEPNWSRISQIVDLLLKHGAHVDAKDVYGDIPLHKYAAINSPGFTIFEKLVSHGADMNTENVKSKVPFDNHNFDGNQIDYYINFFKKYNHLINSWNKNTGEGYFGKILSTRLLDINASSIIKDLIQSPSVKTVDEMGRTLIHNCVAFLQSRSLLSRQNVVTAIEQFSALGIDIDYQDKSGQTALHYAARIDNYQGTEALLQCGADINILDDNGKSALGYAILHQKNVKSWKYLSGPNATASALHLHVKKLEHLKIEVNQQNRNFAKEFQQIIDNGKKKKFDDSSSDDSSDSDYDGRDHRPPQFSLSSSGRIVCPPQFSSIGLSQTFFSQIQLSKTMNVGVNSLTLFDFLSDTGVVKLYSHLPVSDRDVIDDFIATIDYTEFEELAGIIKLQFRKMKARSTSDTAVENEKNEGMECDGIACTS